MIPDEAVEVHSLERSDTGWACSGCDWTAKLTERKMNSVATNEAIDELLSVLRATSPDRYRPPTLRELAQAVLKAGYGKVE